MRERKAERTPRRRSGANHVNEAKTSKTSASTRFLPSSIRQRGDGNESQVDRSGCFLLPPYAIRRVEAILVLLLLGLFANEFGAMI